jgi:hypothetical protein
VDAPRFESFARPIRPAAAILIAAGFLHSLAATGQPLLPLGGQREANTFVSGFQQLPHVARGPLGDTIAVWESWGSPGNDADARSIQGRRFGAGGLSGGTQFQVNTEIVGEQTAPRVAAAPDGRFAIVWQCDDDAGGPVEWNIRARVYAPDGTPAGADFRVNTFTTGGQTAPDVAWGGNDQFIVVWESDDDTGPSTVDWNIVGRAFNAAGAPLTNEFLVNTLTGEQLDPAIAAIAATGEYAVVWESSTSSGGDSTTKSIQLRVLGGPPETQVNSHTPDVADDNPAIAIASDGDLLVAWESWGSAGDDSQRISIQARQYGDVTGPVFQANDYTTDDQRHPTAGYLPDGRFVIGWQSYGSSGNDASEWSVQLRGFTANATPIGDDFQANAYTTNNQLAAALAVDPAGGIVLAWESLGSAGLDQSGSSIQLRRFSLDLIFFDDLETGNHSRWSGHQP